MIRNILLLLLLTLASVGGGFFYTKMNTVQLPVLETPAFVAEMGESIWVLTLQRGYFKPQVKSISIKYDKTLYGIFLPTDKIYLPILSYPTELVMTGMNENGVRVSTHTYTMESNK